jgi:AcrR family transcriptional regulator
LRPPNCAGIPHPFEPLLPERLGAAAPQQRSVARQLARRAQILAATRRLLAETGHERLTLRKVAEACEVTVQTLRNSFGRKEELVAQAVNEHTSAIWLNLARPHPGPQVFIAFPDVIHQVAVQAPGFLRGTLSAAFTDSPSLQVLQDHASANKARVLRGMARAGLIRPGIDLELLADQITKLDTMLMYEWARTGDAEALWEKMLSGHKVLLLGALRPSAAAQVEG